MTLPANIRINARVPFPTLVQGSGPISVTKSLGIWTIKLIYTTLSQLLNPSDLPSSIVAIYDPATQQFNQVTATQIAALASTLVPRTQRSVTGSGELPIVASDSIININNAADLTPLLPLSTTRNGTPVTFNNVSGSHTQTITAVGSDTIDGLATVPIIAGQRLTFWPYNDGVNSGYFID